MKSHKTQWSNFASGKKNRLQLNSESMAFLLVSECRVCVREKRRYSENNDYVHVFPA